MAEDKRLTFKTDLGTSIDKNEDCPTMSICWNCDIPPRKCNYFKDVIDKLAKYEDLEEQGLLFKLPVAIGGIVYRINEYAENPFIPMGVTSVEIKGLTNTFKEIKCKECIYGGEFTYRFSDIGKTLFLTKEDAEKFLAELT